jgi:hypothetical protein
MKNIGFIQAEFIGTTSVTTSQFTAGALFRALKST